MNDVRKAIDMMICPASVEDAKEILGIYANYVRDTAISFEYEVPTIEEFTNRIRTISAKYPYFKAVGEDGRIMGYAYATAFKTRAAYDWSVETTIYLRSDCKGQGIGRALYEELEEALTSMGILNANACIAVTDTEDEHLTNASMHFHEKMGYKLVGKFTKSGYKFNNWYDMIWMEKMLGEHEAVQAPVKFGAWNEY